MPTQLADHFPLAEEVKDLIDAGIDGVGGGIESEVRIFRWFVEAGNTWEVEEFSFFGLGVVSFGVAFSASCLIGSEIDSEETFAADGRGDAIANGQAWSDEGGDTEEAGIVDNFGEVGGASEIFRAIFRRVSEIAVHPLSHGIAIDDDDGSTGIEEFAFEGMGDSGLTGAGETSEKDGGGLLTVAGGSFFDGDDRRSVG